MFGRSVPLVPRKTVTGVEAIIAGHHPVSHNLGNNRGGGDGRGAGVALANRLLGQRPRNRGDSVDQQLISRHSEPATSQLHAREGRL